MCPITQFIRDASRRCAVLDLDGERCDQFNWIKYLHHEEFISIGFTTNVFPTRVLNERVQGMISWRVKLHRMVISFNGIRTRPSQ